MQVSLQTGRETTMALTRAQPMAIGSSLCCLRSDAARQSCTRVATQQFECLVYFLPPDYAIDFRV